MPAPLLPQRLLARIHREFATTTETLTLDGRAVPFTRIKDPDAVLDAICAQETARQRGIQPRRPLRMPYWAAVWESALALGRFLERRDADEPLAGKRALDLGCGMGLAGMALASLGCRVTLVDIETAALLFARLNTIPWDCDVRRCDWQTDDLGERFDLIVGSDVLYEVDQWPFVEQFLRRHLAAGGTAIIGEPGRPKAEAFPEWIRGRGWSSSASRIAEGSRTINVLELSLKSRSSGTRAGNAREVID